MLSQTAPMRTPITVWSPDIDMLVLMLKYAQHIDPVVLLDTGTGNKRRLLNVKQIVDLKGCDLFLCSSCLTLFHWMWHNYCFYERGKVTHLKVLEKFPEFHRRHLWLGWKCNVFSNVIRRSGKACLHVWEGYSRINKLRYDLFSQKYQGSSGQVLGAFEDIDLSLLSSYKAETHEHFLNVPSPGGHV